MDANRGSSPGWSDADQVLEVPGVAARIDLYLSGDRALS